jgi:diguanylate cyclase (GGDEF)-like protein
VDPSLKPQLAEALEHGRIVAISGLSHALPQIVDDDQAQAAEIELGVTSVIAAPLQWDGEQFGLLLLLVGPGQSKQTAATELLAGHVAVAIANLNDREAGRKRGEIDAVRWVYDERRFFEELARESRRAQRYHRSLSMMLVRILNLDELRTRYGRFLSERVLRQVAGRLDDAMRDTDFLGASASDGFGAILIEADQEGAKVAQKRLLAGLQELQFPDSVLADLKIQVGCGAATLPEDGETAEELTAAAEARLRAHTITQKHTSPQEDAASAA